MIDYANCSVTFPISAASAEIKTMCIRYSNGT